MRVNPQTYEAACKNAVANSRLVFEEGTYNQSFKFGAKDVELVGEPGAVLGGVITINNSDRLVISGFKIVGEVSIFSDPTEPVGTIRFKVCEFAPGEGIVSAVTIQASGQPSERISARLVAFEGCTFSGYTKVAVLVGAKRAEFTRCVFDGCGSGFQTHTIYGVWGGGEIVIDGCAFVGAKGENAVDSRGAKLKLTNSVFAWCGAAVSGTNEGAIGGCVFTHGGSYPQGGGAHNVEWNGLGKRFAFSSNIIANTDSSSTGLAINGSLASLDVWGNYISGACVKEGRALWLQGNLETAEGCSINFNLIENMHGTAMIVQGPAIRREVGNRVAGLIEFEGEKLFFEAYNLRTGGSSLLYLGDKIDVSPETWLASLGWTGENVKQEFINRMRLGVSAYLLWARARVGE